MTSFSYKWRQRFWLNGGLETLDNVPVSIDQEFRKIPLDIPAFWARLLLGEIFEQWVSSWSVDFYFGKDRKGHPIIERQNC